MTDKKTSDYIAVTTAPGTYLFDLANPGVSNVKITVDDFIAQVGGGGSGDVVGPASATDNAIVRYNGTTGKLVQDSAVTIDDTGLINVPTGKGLQSAGHLAFTTPTNFSITLTTSGAGGTNLQSGYLDCISTTEFRWANGASTALPKDLGLKRSAAGILTVTNGSTGSGSLLLTAGSASTVPNTVKGAAAQTANLTEWQNSAGTVLASISSSGNLTATNLSGTNTGDQTNITGNAATVTTNANLTGHVTSVGNATTLGSFTSAQLATALTDETGSGANVFATSPTLVTPVLGTPSSGTLTSCTGLPIVAGTTGTLTVARGGSGATTLTGIVKGNGTGAFTAVTAPTGAIVGTTDTQTLTGKTITMAGTLTCANQNIVGVKSATFNSEVNDGNSGTADTIDWGAGNNHKSTMTGNCTYTFTAPAGPASLVLKLVQDATGSRLATFPGTVKWSGGTAPTLTATASRTDIVTFYYDGTNYFGAIVKDFN